MPIILQDSAGKKKDEMLSLSSESAMGQKNSSSNLVAFENKHPMRASKISRGLRFFSLPPLSHFLQMEAWGSEKNLSKIKKAFCNPPNPYPWSLLRSPR